MKLYETLCTQLKKENNFVSDNGELKKWVIADKARNYDADLLALLLANEDLKKTFFKNINGTLVFLLEKFLLFIEQKNYLNDSYTSYRNKIGLTIGGKFLNQRNEVELVWPYKDCILEGGQTKEDQKRPEIFFNQTLAQDEITQLLDPKVLTNAKRYDSDGEKAFEQFNRDAELNAKRGLPADTITDNLIIKGNNLLALHSLKKEFAGKVKLIYIDPPYNTGSDSFGYNDNFNHSTWLTFMKNRLEVAKELLKEDGVIFISINHLELGVLLLLSDEVFGKNNRIPISTLKVGTTASYRSINECPVNVTEYVIGYTKTPKCSINRIYRASTYSEDYSHIIINMNETPEKWIVRPIIDVILEKEKISLSEAKKKYGTDWKRIKYEKMSIFANEHKENVVSLNTLQKPSLKISEIVNQSKVQRGKVFEIKRDNKQSIYCFNGRSLAFFSSKFRYIDGNFVPSEVLTNLWNDISFLALGPEGDVTMENGKKPESLMERIILLSTSVADIVLDFFGGSGTTAAVAHKMNRQYISCEQIDSQMGLITSRLQNVINGDQSGISKSVGWNPQNPSLEDSANGRYNRNNFVYLELKKYNQAFIEKIEEADSSEKLLEIWEQMKEKSFLNYNVDIKTQEENIEDFKQLELAEQKQVLCELLDKNQLYVNVSDMNDDRFATTEEEKKVTEAFYSKM